MTSSTFTGETGSQAVEELARRHPELVTLGRLGWVAKGLVYGVVGLLAVQIALDASGRDSGGAAEQEASQTGAVAEIADTSFGEIALYVVAAGLLLYALWRVISVLLPAESSAKTWLTRVGYLVSAAVYTALGLDGAVVRKTERLVEWRTRRGREGRARHPRGDGEERGAVADRRARCLAHRHRDLLRDQGRAGEVPRRARAARRRPDPP